MFLLFVDAILVNVELGPFENNCQGYDATATAGCFFRAKQRPERQGVRLKNTMKPAKQKKPEPDKPVRAFLPCTCRQYWRSSAKCLMTITRRI
ncbi:MAG: hypothetical protein Q7T10_07080 [Rhodoferax sp.]|uniref:hypothetical protein n=1 Tax=Rhodoferax sp. TaxID=50421 RepID=UPI0027210B27|nr:hypothetical protein [Rhodoferax sp.]MDO8448554.1 hypothetical protein [Rhodoferax sp.]